MNRIYVTLFLVLALAGCRTGGGAPEQVELSDDVRTELDEIQALYATPDCYYARFSVRGNVQGQGEQEARGLIRADNLNERMLMVFQDPFIGITLSRVVIKGGTVYISNPRDGLQKVPLELFQVQGLGNNSIALPFRVFQNLLFARLPEQLFTSAARPELNDTSLTISYLDETESYLYQFEERRLREIRYGRSDLDIEVDLEGVYGRTAFPRTIRMRSVRPAGDAMQIRFSRVDPAASCRDSFFTER